MKKVIFSVFVFSVCLFGFASNHRNYDLYVQTPAWVILDKSLGLIEVTVMEFDPVTKEYVIRWPGEINTVSKKITVHFLD